MTLRQKIEQEIRERGPIPFSRYMELCLYDRELGYYSRHAEQFGKAGDFYTSSDVHAVFGRLLARQFDEMWRALGSPSKIELAELGPGRGLFAQDVLDWSEKKFPEFFRALQYTLVESSPALRQRLEKNLSRHLATGKATLDRASETFEVPIIVFANEFFDAQPVEVISNRGELRIAVKDGRFVESWAPASRDELEFLDLYSVHPEPGERVETSLAAQGAMTSVALPIHRGFSMVIDYGYTRDEQLAGRHRGTLSAFRQHSVSTNPYEAPGEQDITAHVNFTALKAEAEKCDMRVERLLTQSQFLMGIGEKNQFADAFEDCRLPQERAKVALQLKHLVTPAGMGESFHVMVASKGVDAAAVSKLSGLQFGKSADFKKRGSKRASRRWCCKIGAKQLRRSEMAQQHAPRFLQIVDEARKRIRETNVDEVKQQLDRGEKFILVDVREESEYAKDHLPGAIHLGKGVIERDIEARIPDPNAPVVLYCGGGFRSALAADNVQRMGYKNVLSMDGGIRVWREKGFPLTK